jgi:hypothetical protein
MPTFDQFPSRLRAVDDITRTDSLTSLGKSTQRVGVGLDLLGLALGEVDLNCVNDRLLQAAVIFLRGSTQFGVKVGRKPYRHSHDMMVSKCTTLLSALKATKTLGPRVDQTSWLLTRPPHPRAGAG